MDIIRVECLGKSLGIAKGLMFSILENGERIGNDFKIEEIIDYGNGFSVYSYMLNKIVGNFKVSQFVEMIEQNEIELL